MKSFKEYSNTRSVLGYISEQKSTSDNTSFINILTKDFSSSVIHRSTGGKEILSIENLFKEDRTLNRTTESVLKKLFEDSLKKFAMEDELENLSMVIKTSEEGSGSGKYASIEGGWGEMGGKVLPKKGGVITNRDPDFEDSVIGMVFKFFLEDLSKMKSEGGGGGGGKPKAADYEAAICVEYNVISLMKENKKKREGVLEEAMNIAFQGNSDKITKYKNKASPYSEEDTTLTKTGKAVAEGLGSGPKYFVHSGSGLSDVVNMYEGGSDKTPKSDIVGTDGGSNFPREYRYSLKKVGDTGEGAQLMSGKREESKGIFKASWDSWKVGASSKQGIKQLMDDMEKKLTDNIRISSGISVIKEDFKTFLFDDENHSENILTQVKKKLPEKVYTMNYKREWIVKDKGAISDADIQKYMQAIYSLAGLLSETRNFENNIFHEVVEKGKETEKGPIIDVLMNETYTLTIPGKRRQTTRLHELFKMTIAEDRRVEIQKVLDASLKGKELRNDIAEFIQNNENIKRHIVFEAGSGWYKFTGNPHSTNKKGTILRGPEPESAAVADSIMEFSDSGLNKITLMHEYANDHSGLVNQIYVAFKGSGDVRYTSVRMPTESVQNTSSLDTLIEKTISNHFDLLYEDLLMESLWGKIKDYADGAWQKTKQVAASVAQYGRMVLNNVLDFSKRLFEAAVESVKKIFGELYTMLSQGISQFLDFIGMGEPEGDFTLSG